MIWYSLFVLLTLVAWLLLALHGAITRRRASQAPPPPEQFPAISVILAALNEERTIEPAMRSLLEIDYPSLEIIAVNDRSTDATGAILERLAAGSGGRLRIVHVDTLPEGWLGKCHALHVGSQDATGEWLLFTDADVLFDPDILRIAAAFALHHRLGHLVLYPVMIWRGIVEAALLAFFSMSLAVRFQTWRIESRSPRAFIGIGAFNMIRRDLYASFGGHSALRLEIADDMKLGYLAKFHGGRSMAVDSEGKVRVRWRESVSDTIRALERSGFAGVEFNWSLIIASTLFFTCVMLAPYLLPFLSDDSNVTALSLASIAVILALYSVAARVYAMPVWIGLLHPVAALLFAYAMLRSAIVTTARGGVEWRGVFYPIDALKRGSVRTRPALR